MRNIQGVKKQFRNKMVKNTRYHRIRGINLKPFFIITLKYQYIGWKRAPPFPETKRNKYLLITTNLSARYLTNFRISFIHFHFSRSRRIFFTPIRKPYCRRRAPPRKYSNPVSGGGTVLASTCTLTVQISSNDLKRASSAIFSDIIRFHP